MGVAAWLDPFALGLIGLTSFRTGPWLTSENACKSRTRPKYCETLGLTPSLGVPKIGVYRVQVRMRVRRGKSGIRNGSPSFIGSLSEKESLLPLKTPSTGLKFIGTDKI